MPTAALWCPPKAPISPPLTVQVSRQASFSDTNEEEEVTRMVPDPCDPMLATQCLRCSRPNPVQPITVRSQPVAVCNPGGARDSRGADKPDGRELDCRGCHGDGISEGRGQGRLHDQG
eukprot:scaffold6978_cov64-Phaeocystis_antarctica.AAC.2